MAHTPGPLLCSNLVYQVPEVECAFKCLAPVRMLQGHEEGLAQLAMNHTPSVTVLTRGESHTYMYEAPQ